MLTAGFSVQLSILIILCIHVFCFAKENPHIYKNHFDIYVFPQSDTIEGATTECRKEMNDLSFTCF
jgi:hypothetical protein